MGSDLNCNDNYYVSQNNSVVASFYDRSQAQSSMVTTSSDGNDEWMQNNGLDSSRQNSSNSNCQEADKRGESKQRNYIHNQLPTHNQHQWNFAPNPYRLYNDNPYGIILSSNPSSQQVTALIPCTSTENNTQQNVQQQSHHQIKRVFYQGLQKILKI